MTPDLRIPQAIALADSRGIRVVAASEGVDTAEVERIAVLFGPRPPGVACPLAHFACPFGRRQVAVVRVEDRLGPGEVLGFRFLILARDLYRHLGDPFAISDRYPPQWLTGTLSELAWPSEPLPPRTLEALDGILKHGDGPLLLGATQAVIDGVRVLLLGTGPKEALAREMWHLLPDSTRRDKWPASFAFADDLGFHFAILANLPRESSDFPHRGTEKRHLPMNEDTLRDYPAGHYELHLQIAIESGDREGVRRLLARRSSDETLRLAIYLVAFSLLVALLFRFVL